ncbi:MAG: N-formylglutamate amidohydrolase [Alphaproteobacteria bacterium]|nr:N-formylglutamate amidohydrolase [Alphaproteobacteria bacterium]MBU1512588.1 N-formylglutamate amidohydrolase [Alphaproteobacteria bacterium]MBU2092927.1 N-formylglutamate amidohydrolase [Alphaproteobacteria bacterium]MBU2150834.1 N-formylglutamate amidohydrolase [Alphaproteobacteria bacterium]MBU2307954.1 N-formylglutamate amidohydrolase [Alphaproteobacteria bacterium]
MRAMNALEPLPGIATDIGPAFELRRAGPPGAPPTPLVFASPHSGRLYPEDMMSAAALDALSIRRSEDAFVDDLIAQAPDHGATVITANFARAYIDMNREPFELDPGMFSDQLPEFARGRTARVAAGLGAIARVVSEGQEIYRRKLTFAEARRRIDGAHRPYHAALSALMAEAQAAHGFAILVDWHSMPAAAAKAAGRERPCDIVLGDRFGAACAGVLPTRVERELEGMGYRVTRNTPYAGGYTTEHYGQPHRRAHALQIEINRGLYLDEATLSPTSGFEALRAHVEQLTKALAAADWSALKAS